MRYIKVQNDEVEIKSHISLQRYGIDYEKYGLEKKLSESEIQDIKNTVDLDHPKSSEDFNKKIKLISSYDDPTKKYSQLMEISDEIRNSALAKEESDQLMQEVEKSLSPLQNETVIKAVSTIEKELKSLDSCENMAEKYNKIYSVIREYEISYDLHQVNVTNGHETDTSKTAQAYLSPKINKAIESFNKERFNVHYETYPEHKTDYYVKIQSCMVKLEGSSQQSVLDLFKEYKEMTDGERKAFKPYVDSLYQACKDVYNDERIDAISKAYYSLPNPTTTEKIAKARSLPTSEYRFESVGYLREIPSNKDAFVKFIEEPENVPDKIKPFIYDRLVDKANQFGIDESKLDAFTLGHKDMLLMCKDFNILSKGTELNDTSNKLYVDIIKEYCNIPASERQPFYDIVQKTSENYTHMLLKTSPEQLHHIDLPRAAFIEKCQSLMSIDQNEILTNNYSDSFKLIASEYSTMSQREKAMFSSLMEETSKHYNPLYQTSISAYDVESADISRFKDSIDLHAAVKASAKLDDVDRAIEKYENADLSTIKQILSSKVDSLSHSSISVEEFYISGLKNPENEQAKISATVTSMVNPTTAICRTRDDSDPFLVISETPIEFKPSRENKDLYEAFTGREIKDLFAADTTTFKIDDGKLILTQKYESDRKQYEVTNIYQEGIQNFVVAKDIASNQEFEFSTYKAMHSIFSSIQNDIYMNDAGISISDSEVVTKASNTKTLEGVDVTNSNVTFERKNNEIHVYKDDEDIGQIAFIWKNEDNSYSIQTYVGQEISFDGMIGEQKRNHLQISADDFERIKTCSGVTCLTVDSDNNYRLTVGNGESAIVPFSTEKPELIPSSTEIIQVNSNDISDKKYLLNVNNASNELQIADRKLQINFIHAELSEFSQTANVTVLATDGRATTVYNFSDLTKEQLSILTASNETAKEQVKSLNDLSFVIPPMPTLKAAAEEGDLKNASVVTMKDGQVYIKAEQSNGEAIVIRDPSITFNNGEMFVQHKDFNGETIQNRIISARLGQFDKLTELQPQQFMYQSATPEIPMVHNLSSKMAVSWDPEIKADSYEKLIKQQATFSAETVDWNGDFNPKLISDKYGFVTDKNNKFYYFDSPDIITHGVSKLNVAEHISEPPKQIDFNEYAAIDFHNGICIKKDGLMQTFEPQKNVENYCDPTCALSALNYAKQHSELTTLAHLKDASVPEGTAASGWKISLAASGSPLISFEETNNPNLQSFGEKYELKNLNWEAKDSGILLAKIDNNGKEETIQLGVPAKSQMEKMQESANHAVGSMQGKLQNYINQINNLVVKENSEEKDFSKSIQNSQYVVISKGDNLGSLYKIVNLPDRNPMLILEGEKTSEIGLRTIVTDPEDFCKNKSVTFLSGLSDSQKENIENVAKDRPISVQKISKEGDNITLRLGTATQYNSIGTGIQISCKAEEHVTAAQSQLELSTN
jgi:hypothetical protein